MLLLMVMIACLYGLFESVVLYDKSLLPKELDLLKEHIELYKRKTKSTNFEGYKMSVLMLLWQ